MHIIQYQEQAPDGLIECTYINVGAFRLLIAVSEVNWYTKGIARRFPIWISKKGLFVYKVAIRLGKRPKD